MKTKKTSRVVDKNTDPTIYGYKDGKIMSADKMFVSVYDIGLLRGFAIYEGITTCNEKAFRLADHLKRFRTSAKKLGIKIQHSDTEIGEIVNSLIKKNNFGRINLRFILSGGNAIGGIEFNPNTPTFYILPEKFIPMPESLYKNGGKMITEDYQRFMPEVKSIHYITAVLLQNKKKKAKAVEILYTANGKVLECSTSNVFMIKNGTLITAKSNVLFGITRKVVLEIAKKYFKIEEREITMAEFAKADEVFIASSYKDIVPIVKIDDRVVADGKVGKNTKVLMDLFAEVVSGY